MKRQLLVAAAVLTSVVALLMLVYLLEPARYKSPEVALAAPLDLTVLEVGPSYAPNDLDTRVIITGTDFIFTPTVYLGNTSLEDVEWMSATRLMATVPWGMTPGVYTLTVENPSAESTSLANAFTVTQGIGVWTAGKLYGGKVGQLVVNPLTPTTVYAVSGDVGLFRSQDGGENWSHKVAGGVYSVRNLAIDPLDPNRLYMFAPWTLHRSDDGGDTWIPLYAPGEDAYPHPTISGTVYAGNRWDGTGGLWKSEDYGQTWVTVTTGLTDTRVNDVVFHPTDPLTMYLGTRGGHLFGSTNGGQTWTYVATPVPVNGELTLAFNPYGSHELWASNGCMNMPNVTLKSTNAEHTAWITVANPVGSLACPFIEFAPVGWGDTYSQTMLAGGCWGTPYKTMNGGDSWVSFGPGAGGGDVALHPTDPNTIYVGDDGASGVHKTTNGGASWRAINQGLTLMYPDQLATVKGHPDVVYALMKWNEDGIYKATRGGEVWQFLDTPDGGSSTLVDPFTPTIVYLGTNERVYRSEDGGQSWPTYGELDPPDVCLNTQMFAPEVLRADPTQAGTLLAGIHGFCNDFAINMGAIYRSTDHGATWTTTLTASQHISPVTDLAYDIVTPTIVYAATGPDGKSGMLKSTDGGQTWQRMGEGIVALDEVRSIAVEPSPPYRVFALTKYDGLYASENHGESWAKVGSTSGDFQRILFTHEDPPVLYFATSGGLYRSTNGGQSWRPADGILGQVPVYSLAEVTATGRVILYAGTTGGYIASVTDMEWDVASNGDTLVSPGVYRYTTRRLRKVFLPLVLKAYTE